MKDQIVDFETSKMLKELGVNIPFLYWWNPNGVLIEKFLDVDAVVGVDDLLLNHNLICEHYKAPLWSQIEEWIFDNYRIHLSINRWITGTFDYMVYENERCITIWDLDRQATLYFKTPIDARVAGIKNVVEFLHRNTAVKAVTPNNTKPNSH
jgi:hypothetical protein